MALLVNEIFHSIQGESVHSGRPCVFIRLTGCNLRCGYCDTRYAYQEGFEASVEELILRAAEHGCRLVEVTGGEPLLQKETPALVSGLLGAGHEVMIETNGSLDIDLVDDRCSRIVDVKCPTSNESGQNDLNNLNRITSRDNLKFVIGNSEDYAYAKRVMKSVAPGFPRGNILLSPVNDQLKPARLARWILADRLACRLQLQLHKIIWPRETRGV